MSSANMVIQSTSGNFALRVEGTLSDEAQQAILKKGVASELYRAVFPRFYAAKFGKPGKRNADKLVLPADFERSSVEFDEELAAEFASFATTELAKIGFTGGVRVSKWVASENGGDGRKRAQGVFDKASEKGDEALVKLAALCDYEGDIEDAEKFVEAIHKWLMDS